MDTGWIIATVIALLFGALTFGYGGFTLTEAHPFLTVLSYIFAVGCVTGAIAIGILAPRRFEAEKENARLKDALDELTQEGSRARSRNTQELLPAVIPENVPAIVRSETAILTPQYLVNLFKGRTELQAQHLVREHLGRDITVSGTIRAIAPLMMSDQSQMTIKHEPTILAYFDGSWRDRLNALHIEDQVSVTGKVEAVNESVVALVNCKIVSLA
jgi:hypothetical protein